MNLAGPGDELGRHLIQEAGRRIPLRRAPRGARQRARQVQPRTRPGDADVGQPAFLGHLARIAERASVREDAFLHAGQEDDRELQPLRGVQGHERDHAARRIRNRVGVRDQRDLLEKGVQIAGLRRPLPRLFELASNIDQLTQVVDASLVLRITARLELPYVSGFVQNRLENLARRARPRRRPGSRSS